MVSNKNKEKKNEKYPSSYVRYLLSVGISSSSRGKDLIIIFKRGGGGYRRMEHTSHRLRCLLGPYSFTFSLSSRAAFGVNSGSRNRTAKKPAIWTTNDVTSSLKPAPSVVLRCVSVHSPQ